MGLSGVVRFVGCVMVTFTPLFGGEGLCGSGVIYGWELCNNEGCENVEIINS